MWLLCNVMASLSHQRLEPHLVGTMCWSRSGRQHRRDYLSETHNDVPARLRIHVQGGNAATAQSVIDGLRRGLVDTHRIEESHFRSIPSVRRSRSTCGSSASNMPRLLKSRQGCPNLLAGPAGWTFSAACWTGWVFRMEPRRFPSPSLPIGVTTIVGSMASMTIRTPSSDGGSSDRDLHGMAVLLAEIGGA